MALDIGAKISSLSLAMVKSKECKRGPAHTLAGDRIVSEIANQWCPIPYMLTMTVLLDLEAEGLQCGGANIWNALAIDYPSDSFSHVVIKHEGLQGKLPNMDVINAFTRIAQRTNAMPVSLSAASEHDHGWKSHSLGVIGDHLQTYLWKDGEGAKKYLSGLLNVLSQIGYLASGKPSGIHGVFHR